MRNPIARVVRGIRQQVIPDKRNRARFKPNYEDELTNSEQYITLLEVVKEYQDKNFKYFDKTDAKMFVDIESALFRLYQLLEQ